MLIFFYIHIISDWPWLESLVSQRVESIKTGAIVFLFFYFDFVFVFCFLFGNGCIKRHYMTTRPHWQHIFQDQRKNTNLSLVTDKLYHITWYWVIIKLVDRYNISNFQGVEVFVIGWWLDYNYPSLQSFCEYESRWWRGVLNTTLCDKVCQWQATGWCFFSDLGKYVVNVDVSSVLCFVSCFVWWMWYRYGFYGYEFGWNCSSGNI
jgi:hypothetical protein